MSDLMPGRRQVLKAGAGLLAAPLLAVLPHFRFIHALMGAERILFSIDDPYQSLDGVRAFLQSLPVSASEKALIAHGNAERLLRLRPRVL